MTPASVFARPVYRWVEVPPVVIIEGGAPILRFRNRISNLPVVATLILEEDALIRYVFESIAYENNAELELGYNALEIAHDAVGYSWADDVDVVVSAMVEYGTALYKQLREYRLYRQGYLFYQFNRWLGTDLVLARIDPPELQ